MVTFRLIQRMTTAYIWAFGRAPAGQYSRAQREADVRAVTDAQIFIDTLARVEPETVDAAETLADLIALARQLSAARPGDTPAAPNAFNPDELETSPCL